MKTVKFIRPTFKRVSEGQHIFRIYDCYLDPDHEGRIVLSVVNPKGETHNELFFTLKKNGELNEYAIGQFCGIVETVIDTEYTEDEVDPEILINSFIKAEYSTEKSETDGKSYGHIRNVQYATEEEFEEFNPVDKAYELSSADRPKSRKEKKEEKIAETRARRENRLRQRQDNSSASFKLSL